MLNVIKYRLDVWEEEPIYWEHMVGIDRRLYASSLTRSLIELIKIRASQINKCVYCIDYHTQEAIAYGESPRRIFLLAAWEESPLFTDKEKAVLEATEEITHISEHGLTDQTHQKLQKYFSKLEIANIIVCICHINFLNRVGIATRTVAT
ncbi:carboxymuconolactone decarboxylase family protein [Pedobacter heparinus]|uniref:carboxymuconolactone decarboxylase family protein n=1 Tax=Pedobacter heparinus TaxID=984 RepID=UPI00292F955E|nr:carboxymuconolactone decarboxylase family protein [Pedobacter heparinus]